MSDETDSNGETGVVRAQYDWDEVDPSTAVVETLAVATDSEPTAMGPLYDAVDPDALNSLVAGDGRLPDVGDAVVSFEVDGLEVTVRATGEVVVRTVS